MPDLSPAELHLRLMLRAQLAPVVPSKHLAETLDLVMAGMNEPLQALARVMQRASDQRIAICAMGPALCLLRDAIADKIGRLPELAATLGLPCERFELTEAGNA